MFLHYSLCHTLLWVSYFINHSPYSIPPELVIAGIISIDVVISFISYFAPFTLDAPFSAGDKCIKEAQCIYPFFD